MPELRISDVLAGPTGQRRVDLTWTDWWAWRIAAAVSQASPGAGDQNGELIRWYLAEYAEYPADPAPERARQAEAALTAAVADPFDQVFASRDAIAIRALTADRLAETRVGVAPTQVRGRAWGLLCDPGADSPRQVTIRLLELGRRDS